MKRIERHHLKDNEVATQVQRAREILKTRKGEITAAGVALVVVGAIAIGYFVWNERTEVRSQALLAEALVIQNARIGPPVAPDAAPSAAPVFPTEGERDEAALAKFKVIADAYPKTDAGIFARYGQATVLTALGRPTEAAVAFQDVITRSGDRLYGEVARLGLAEAQARSGQFDQAINGFKALAERKDGTLPVDGVLMQLGRTCLDAGKPADARQALDRLVGEYPDSPFTEEARQALNALNVKKT